MQIKKENRPLSPHLLVYKPQVTSVFSIFHRISGSFLALIVLFLPLWFIFLNSFSSFGYTYWLYLAFHLLCQIAFYVLCITFFFHCLNGFRHMLWDLGIGLDLNNLFVTACLVLGLTLILSIIVIIF